MSGYRRTSIRIPLGRRDQGSRPVVTRSDLMYGLTTRVKLHDRAYTLGDNFNNFSHPTFSDATSSQLNRSDDSIISATPHIYDASSSFANDSYSRGDGISNT